MLCIDYCFLTVLENIIINTLHYLSLIDENIYCYWYYYYINYLCCIYVGNERQSRDCTRPITFSHKNWIDFLDIVSDAVNNNIRAIVKSIIIPTRIVYKSI